MFLPLPFLLSKQQRKKNKELVWKESAGKREPYKRKKLNVPLIKVSLTKIPALLVSPLDKAFEITSEKVQSKKKHSVTKW